MLTRQQKRTLVTAVKYIVPIVVVFLIVMTLLVGYTLQSITHPPHTPYSSDLKGYEFVGVFVPKSDESWNLKGGGTGSGWLLRSSTGAPAIILSHSYGQNLADLLSLGVGLQRAGYHVLLYDLRAHGQNKQEATTLGDMESDDLLSAIDHIKNLKDENGNPLIDKERIGLYGVSIGGYASLVAAGKEPAVKAVVVDAVYPDVPRYVKIRVKQFSGFSNSLISYFADLGMKYYSSKYGQTSASKAVRNYTDVKQLYIIGKDTGDLQAATGELYNQALPQKETVEVPHSRINILYKNDQDVYDPVVVDFFRRPDVIPPLVTPDPAAQQVNAELDKKP